MSSTVVFDYYYGMEAETFCFYRIPKVLFTDPYFKKVSCEAKVLYGLMLDRMSLSIKNRWFDEQNRVYIIFTIDDARQLLGCCKQTAVNLMAELDTKKGIGLIEKKRLGLGKANIIYVRNFMVREGTNKTETPPSSSEQEKYTSRSLENRLQEVHDLDFCNSDKKNSGSPENGLQEVCKAERNNTDKRKTDCNKTDQNETEEEAILSYPSVASYDEGRCWDQMDRYLSIQARIKENIDYPILCQRYSEEDVNGIVVLMTDTICSKRARIMIGGDYLPSEIVKDRLMNLNYSHLEYVFESMSKNTTKIRNIKQYLMTSLYNAPATIGHYYSAEVKHDLYGM